MTMVTSATEMPGQPAEPAAKPSAVDSLKEKAKARASARRPSARAASAAAPEAPPAPAEPPAPEPQGEPPAAAPPQQTAPADPPAAPPTDGGDTMPDLDALNVKIAQLRNQSRAYERKFREEEAAKRQLEEQLKAKGSVWEGDNLEAKIEAAKAAGLDLGTWTNHALGRGDDLTPQQPESPEMKALRAEVDELREWRAQSKEADKQRELREAHQRDIKHITSEAEGKDQWGVINEFGRQSLVAERYYALEKQQGYAPQLSDVMDQVASEIVSGTKSLLRHNKVRDLAKADPELFAELRTFFVGEQEQPAPSSEPQAPSDKPAASRGKGRGNGARQVTPSQASSATSFSQRRQTKADRIARATERLRATRNS